MRTRLPAMAMGLMVLATPCWSQAPSDSTERDVLGTLVLEFALSEGAVVPKPPFEVSMQIYSGAGEQLVFRVNDPRATWTTDSTSVSRLGRLPVARLGQNFVISLPPGSYKVSALLIKAPDISGGDTEFELATTGPFFSVTQAPCTYIGRAVQTYVRLPPGAKQHEAIDVLSKRMNRAGAFYMAFDRGGFMMPAFLETNIPASYDTVIAGRSLYDRARERGCKLTVATRSSPPAAPGADPKR